MFFEIKNKIEQYDKIVILRHIRPDGDAVGSSLGLRDILQNTYPNKKVKCFAKDFAESLNFTDLFIKVANREKLYKATNFCLGYILDG